MALAELGATAQLSGPWRYVDALEEAALPSAPLPIRALAVAAVGSDGGCGFACGLALKDAAVGLTAAAVATAVAEAAGPPQGCSGSEMPPKYVKREDGEGVTIGVEHQW